ncbi:MAG: AarF/UbiB family protein [Ghiorsea sp.]|nr:AarF/UbiB family protein [Ghiorsea sp.]
MLWETLSAARDLSRLHDLASILIRFGFGDVVQRLGVTGALERAGKVLHWKEASELARLDTPERMCKALEEMGPTFIKLGQMLATRVDLFPSEWIKAFEKLQNHSSAMDFPTILDQLQEELGVPPEEVFAQIDTNLLGAASIAQVLKAELPTGEQVVIKVRRPGIRPMVEADLRLMRRLADIMESESTELRRFQPKEVVRQFTLSFRRELDLGAECRNAERIARNFKQHTEIVIPKVHWDWTSERINVQAYIHGISGRDYKAMDEAGLDRKVLARRGAQAILKMILEDGFFHADLHPGNVFYLAGNRIAFIDFGMVGRLSEKRRYQVIEFLHGLVTQASEQVVEILLDWSGNVQVDRDALSLEIDAFIDQYHGVPLKQMNIGGMLTSLTVLLREHQLALPADLALLIKSFISLESMGRNLDPDFDMVSEAQPFLERAMLAHYAPSALAKRGWQTLSSTFDILTGLPHDLRQLARSARSGKFKLHIDVDSLKRFGNQLDRSASRLAVGNVIAALIIGSSIVMTVDGGPTLFGLPLFGLLGFIGASLGGIWLLASIWRSGRER